MRDLITQLAEPVTEPLRRLGRNLRGYDLDTLRGDATAGASVAVVAVPQSMAYAFVAGVPPEYGLYTLIVQSLVGGLLTGQPAISPGPMNTHSLLVASIVTRIAGSDPGLYLSLVFSLTLLKGLMQMAMGWARLGRLVQYVSRSVIVGFTAGAGVLIAAGQLEHFLGVSTQRDPAHWPGVIGTVQRLVPHLGQVSFWAVGLGVLSLTILVALRWISPLVPGPLVAVAGAGGIVYLAGLTPEHLTLVPELPAGFVPPQLPTLELAHLEPLLLGALALSVLGLIEVYSVGKSLAAKTGTRLDANQEMFSQGATNFISSFFNCFPGSASFARSGLGHYVGARTQLTGVFNALCVLAIFLLFAPVAAYIPMSAIAAILFVIAYTLIDFQYLRRVLRSERADAIVCLGTFLATLVVPLTYAVFVGIFLNIALYLRRASQLHLQEMVRTPEGPFVERPVHVRSGEKKVMFLQIEGDLFFGVADELHDRLSQIAHSGVSVVILRLKRTLSIDATVLSVLEQFVNDMHARHGHVVLCGVRDDLHERLEGFGLVAGIGRANVFPVRYGVFASAKAALQRARELVGSSLDMDQELLADDETEGWSYQI